MKIITKQHKIDNITKSWYKQYKRYMTPGGDKLEIYEKLLKLDQPTEAEIIDIIGNKSWTENYCDECGEDWEILIQIGQEPDYESRTAKICQSCLRKASDIILSR